MAKDGTRRGGARPGAGRKKKSLQEKIESGNPGGRKLKVLDIPVGFDDPEAVDMPEPSEYLSAQQRDGKPLGADETYRKTMNWLIELKCDKYVSPQLVEQYSVCVARYRQCEEAINSLGLIGKHPTSGKPIQSPFVAMSHNYMKQANIVWAEISQIVKENCSVEFSKGNPEEDMMESLLRAR
ncbi:MAG: terminase [Mogibacterium sp.]|nr:terminase [Mogibacterium sp.]MBR0380307.1 terminase [Mogibacterium sp.]